MRRTKLIRLAQEAGLRITVEGTKTTIVRDRNHAVVLYEDGSAFDATVRLDIAKRITIYQASIYLKLA